MKKQLLLISITFLTSIDSHAQWFQTSNINGSYCFDFIGHLVAASGNGVYQNSYNTWIQDLSTPCPVNAIAHNSEYIFIGTNGSCGNAAYWSNDNGNSWWEGGSGLGNTLVTSLDMHDDTAIAGTLSGVYKSVYNGLSWSTWSAVNSGLPTADISSVAINNSDFFVGTNGFGVYISSNGGITWSAINTGLTGSESVRDILFNGNDIFIATSAGVYLSSNDGSSWSSITSSLFNQNFFSVAVNSTTIFAGTDSSGIFLSTDYGITWNPVNTGLEIPLTTVWSLATTPNGAYVYAGFSANHGVFKATVSELTGISETATAATPFSVYANPATHQLVIRNTAHSEVRLQLYNSIGQLLLQERFSEGTFILNIADYQNPVLFYSVLCENIIVQSGKFITN